MPTYKPALKRSYRKAGPQNMIALWPTQTATLVLEIPNPDWESKLEAKLKKLNELRLTK